MKNVTSELPPYDTNGSVTPTTGARPSTIATLTTTCQNVIAATPTQITAPTRSRADSATLMIQTSRNANTAIRNTDPAKPHSSAHTEYGKSVQCSGTKLNWFCVPSRKPLPQIFPEPTAKIDCWVCQQFPVFGATLQSMKPRIRFFW